MTIACVLAACGAAVWITWPAQAPETPAPEQRQSDGSLLLERKPAATPPARPHKIPPRTTLERTVQVTVQPDAPAPAAGDPCPPVTVDMSLVREESGARRVIASSPDGRVITGLDIPIEPAPPPPRLWAAGLSWSPNQTYGVWIERDMKLPLLNAAARIGLDLNQSRAHTSAPEGYEARVRVGFAF